MSGIGRFKGKKASGQNASASKAAATAAAAIAPAPSAVEHQGTTEERDAFAVSFCGGDRPSSAGDLSTTSDNERGMFHFTTGFGATGNDVEDSSAAFSIGYDAFDMEPDADPVNIAAMTEIPRDEFDLHGTINGNNVNAETKTTETDPPTDSSSSKGAGGGFSKFARKRPSKKPEATASATTTSKQPEATASRANATSKQPEATASATSKQPGVQPPQVGPPPNLFDSNAATVDMNDLGGKELPPSEVSGPPVATPEMTKKAAAEAGGVPVDAHHVEGVAAFSGEHGREKGIIPSSNTDNKIGSASSTSLLGNEKNKDNLEQPVEDSPPPVTTPPASRTFHQGAAVDSRTTFPEGGIADQPPLDVPPKNAVEGLLAPNEATTVTPEPRTLLADTPQQSPAEYYTGAPPNNDVGMQGNVDAPIPSEPSGTLTSPMRDQPENTEAPPNNDVGMQGNVDALIPSEPNGTLTSPMRDRPENFHVNGSGDAEAEVEEEEESFDDLLTAFVGDLRDTMDLVEKGDADLLDLEVLHAQAYSSALQLLAEQMDFMEEVETLTASVRATIRECRS